MLMKKNITLLIGMFCSTLLMSQNILIDRLPNNINIPSTRETNSNGLFAADQFELASTTALGSITVFGFNRNTPSIVDFVEGLNIIIYEDNGTPPTGNPQMDQAGLVELRNIDLSNVTADEGDNFSNFTIDITAANGGSQVVLAPGDYWISIFPNVNTQANGDGLWAWFTSDSDPESSDSIFIDPEDILDQGNMEWVTLTSLAGFSIPSMAWQLADETLSLEENLIDGLSIYPNPTEGIINIFVPPVVKLDNIAIFDVFGRQVLNLNSSVTSIDLTNLSSGIYLAKFVTSDGSQEVVQIVRN